MLQFKAIHSSEQLGQLFAFRVALVSLKSDIRIDDVLGKSMTMNLYGHDIAPRYFNGIVTRCT